MAESEPTSSGWRQRITEKLGKRVVATVLASTAAVTTVAGGAYAALDAKADRAHAAEVSRMQDVQPLSRTVALSDELISDLQIMKPERFREVHEEEAKFLARAGGTALRASAEGRDSILVIGGSQDGLDGPDSFDPFMPNDGKELQARSVAEKVVNLAASTPEYKQYADKTASYLPYDGDGLESIGVHNDDRDGNELYVVATTAVDGQQSPPPAA
jgi:hypothetical protein